MPIRSAVRVVGHPQTTVVLRATSGPPETVVTALPRETDRHTVIVAADPPLPVAELAAILADRLPVGCASIRLVLSHAGRPDVARPLADRLRLEVVAPNGAVTLLPGGRVFVSGGDWTAYRPGQPPVRQGPRHPAPSWEIPVPPGFAATPAGLWLHGGAGPNLPPALLAIPVDPTQPTVVIGHPGAPISGAAELADLPRATRRRLLLVPYGPDSAQLHRIAERLASRDGGTIEVLAGVPDTGPHGEPVLTTVDAHGRRGWQPLASRVRYRAAAAPEVIAARPGAAHGPVTGVFTARSPSAGDLASGMTRTVASDDLATEVVRAGLWLRGDHDGDAEAARRVPADAHPLLVLGSTALADIVALPARVAALAPLLPGLRLVVTHPPADGRAPQWRELTERYGPVLAVVGDGELAVLPASDQLGTGEYPLITPRLPASPPPAAVTPPAAATRSASPLSVDPAPSAVGPVSDAAGTTSEPAGASIAISSPADPASADRASADPAPGVSGPAVSGPGAEAASEEAAGTAPAAGPATSEGSSRPVRTTPAPIVAASVTRLVTADFTPGPDAHEHKREQPGQAVCAAWLPPENAWPPPVDAGSPATSTSATSTSATSTGATSTGATSALATSASAMSTRAAAWAPGQVLAIAGPATAATADIAPREALVLVWSISGQPRQDRTLEFSAGTHFRVLAVDGPATEPSRVLLRELAAHDTRSDDAVRESLRRLAAARQRATAGVGQPPAAS